jgi:hypothetical protein
LPPHISAQATLRTGRATLSDRIAHRIPASLWTLAAGPGTTAILAVVASNHRVDSAVTHSLGDLLLSRSQHPLAKRAFAEWLILVTYFDALCLDIQGTYAVG